jgi:hypothetical protein
MLIDEAWAVMTDADRAAWQEEWELVDADSI